jgi:hypothetical protein
MTALNEECKQQIIDEEPGGIWLVLNEEFPRETLTAGDLLAGEPHAGCD